MKLDIWPFSLAVGLVTAVVFSICAFFVAVAPEATMASFSYLLHVDLTGLARSITWGSYLAGLVAVSLGAAISAALVAWLYNRLVQ
jgi:hypothetical protein